MLPLLYAYLLLSAVRMHTNSPRKGRESVSVLDAAAEVARSFSRLLLRVIQITDTEPPYVGLPRGLPLVDSENKRLAKYLAGKILAEKIQSLIQ